MIKSVVSLNVLYDIYVITIQFKKLMMIQLWNYEDVDQRKGIVLFYNNIVWQD